MGQTTDFFNRLESPQGADAKTVRELCELIRRMVEMNIPAHLRPTVSVTSAANHAVYQTLEKLRKEGRGAFRDSRASFMAFLYCVAERRLQDRLRSMGAERRDPGSPIEGGDALLEARPAENSPPPVAELSEMREVLEKMIGETLELPPLDRYTVLLGVMLELEGAVVHRVLKKHAAHLQSIDSPEAAKFHVPSPNTIRERINQRRQEMERKFDSSGKIDE